MRRQSELADAFQRARPRLVRVAYAVLGSTRDAEDVVSDSWLRLVQADTRAPIVDVDAWATVAVARLPMDVLRSARSRREQYVGPWLPEPIVEVSADPADRVTLDESVSFALLVMLETLSPAERTSFVLHDLFHVPFTEVAEMVGRSPAAVRQLAARARRHIGAGGPRLPVSDAEHDAAVTAFVNATNDGDLRGLLQVLDPDVVLTSDGGGRVNAARRPVHTAERVGRFILGITRNVTPTQAVRPVVVNGRTGLALFDDGRITTVISLSVRNHRIERIDFVMAPEKLPRQGSSFQGLSGDAQPASSSQPSTRRP